MADVSDPEAQRAGPTGPDPWDARPAADRRADDRAPAHSGLDDRPAARPPDASGPTRRVIEEGGSPAVVKWVARTERVAAPIAPFVGFWATVYARFARHRGAVLAGGLAFFGLLSLVPSFLSLGAVVALLYDPTEFVEDVEVLLADRPEAVDSVSRALDDFASLSGTATASLSLTGLVGLAVSLYAASRFVYVGRQVLDVTFELDPQPPSVLSRAIAILITALVQVGIVVGVIALTLIPRLLEAFGIGETYAVMVRLMRLPVLLMLAYLALTVAMRFGTRARRVVGWANPGALLGTTTILLGTLGLSWFLSVSLTYSQMVAVLGGVIALELWLYVIGVAIVVSAEVEGIRHGFRRRDLEAPRAP